MVSLPERRRSSSPLARPRFSSAAGTFSGTLLTNFGPVGRPASARAAWAWAAAGSMTSTAACAARPAPWRVRRRVAAPSASSAAAAAARCSWISRSFSARSVASFSERSRDSSASRASATSRSLLPAVRFLRLGGLDGLQPPLELGVGQAGRACRRGRRWAGAIGRGAGLGDQDALALVLDRDRLGATVAEALAHMARLGAAPAQPERLALAVAVLGIHHSRSSLSRGGLPPPIHRRPRPRTRLPCRDIPDA